MCVGDDITMYYCVNVEQLGLHNLGKECGSVSNTIMFRHRRYKYETQSL